MKLTHIAVAISLTAATSLSQAAITQIDFRAGGDVHYNVLVGEVNKSGNYNLNFTLTPKDDKQRDLINFQIFTSDLLGYNRRLVHNPALNANQFQDTFELSLAGPSKIFFTFETTTNYGWSGTLTSKVSSSVAPVPEPETYALMGMGLVGLLAARRRSSKK